jgi:hypothetical protein
MVEQAADEARRAALRRIEEESQRELESAQPPLELVEEDRIKDITESSEPGTVSASEIMDSMVNCKLTE